MQNENAITTCTKKQQPVTKIGRKRSVLASFAAGFLCIIFRATILQQTLFAGPDANHPWMEKVKLGFLEATRTHGSSGHSAWRSSDFFRFTE